MAIKKRALGIAFVAAALLVALAGVAWAAIPGAGGVISGCYGKQSGILRVIDAAAGDDCNNSSELPISWNEQGQPGPQVHRARRDPRGLRDRRVSVAHRDHPVRQAFPGHAARRVTLETSRWLASNARRARSFRVSMPRAPSSV